MSNFTFSPQCFLCTLYPLIATFQLSSAASLNLGRSQNGVQIAKGLDPCKLVQAEKDVYILQMHRKPFFTELDLFHFLFPEEWSGDESGNSSPGKDNNSKSKEEGDINQVGADSRLLPNIEQDTNASVKTENGKDTTNKTKQKPDDSRIDSNVKQKEASSERDLGNTETKVKTHIQTEDQAKDVIKEKRNVEALSKGSDAINESVTDNTEQDDQPIDKPVDKCESSRTDVMQKLTEKDCDKIVEDHAKITATEETLGEKSKAEKGGDVASNERKLKTSVKGDMVVVKDRESPSSESSGNKGMVTLLQLSLGDCLIMCQVD